MKIDSFNFPFCFFCSDLSWSWCVSHCTGDIPDIIIHPQFLISPPQVSVLHTTSHPKQMLRNCHKMFGAAVAFCTAPRCLHPVGVCPVRLVTFPLFWIIYTFLDCMSEWVGGYLNMNEWLIEWIQQLINYDSALTIYKTDWLNDWLTEWVTDLLHILISSSKIYHGINHVMEQLINYDTALTIRQNVHNNWHLTITEYYAWFQKIQFCLSGTMGNDLEPSPPWVSRHLLNQRTSCSLPMCTL